MKANALIFLGLIAVSFNAYSKNIDQIECLENPKEASEILKLFGVIKNSVLGTVPKFCRSHSPDQLTDNDIASQDLNDFVEKLKSSLRGVPDTTIVDNQEDTKKDAIVLNTFRLIVLKKIWINLNEDNQIQSLVSNACGKHGLNRTILNKEYKNNKVILKDQDKALKTFYTACNIDNYEELAPYLTKDVLAEGLFHLKRIFPQSFPALLDSLCNELKNTDELIYKKDMYVDVIEKIDESKKVDEFSNWLKNLYKELSNENKVSKLLEVSKENLLLKTIEEAEEKLANQDENTPGSQKYLKKYYQKNPKLENEEKPVVPIYLQDRVVGKGPDGKYFLMVDPVFQNNTNEKIKSYEQLKIKKTEETVNNYINTIKTTMENQYKLAEAEGLLSKPVPYPGSEGFFINKNEDGTYYLYLSEEMRKLVEKRQAIYEKNFDETVPKNQGILKKIYEAQQKYGANYISPTINSKLGKGRYVKIILKDGIYLEEPYIPLSAESIKESYNKMLPLLKEGEMIAFPIYSNGLLLQTKSGEYVETFGGSNFSGDEKNKIKKIIPLNLEKTLRNSYQARTANFNKISDLSVDEIGAVEHYTGFGFGALNGCLRNNNCDKDSQVLTKNLISVMKKIKNKEINNDYITLYRGAKIPDAILEQLKKEPDGFVIDKGFMSTTAAVETAKSFSSGSNLLILKVKSCVGISGISSLPSEDEFLCPPGMKFNVKKQPGSNDRIFVIEEVK